MKIFRGFINCGSNKTVFIENEEINGSWIYWDMFGKIVDMFGNRKYYTLSKSKVVDEHEIESRKLVYDISEVLPYLVNSTIGEKVDGTEFFVHDIVEDRYGKRHKVIYNKSLCTYGLKSEEKGIFIRFYDMGDLNFIRTEFERDVEEEWRNRKKGA